MIAVRQGRALRGAPVPVSPTAHAALSVDFPAATTVVVDGHIVDLVAVARCLDGDRVPLRPTEARFAVRYGTQRLGLTTAELEQCLDITDRTIVRYRKEHQS